MVPRVDIDFIITPWLVDRFGVRPEVAGGISAVGATGLHRSAL